MSSQSLAAADQKTTEIPAGENLAAKHYGPTPTPVLAVFGAVSDIGLVRTNNEDHYLVTRRSRTRQILLTNHIGGLLPPTVEEAFVMAVADGMGGEAFGELASRLVLTTAWELAPRENTWLLNTGAVSLELMREKLTAFVQLIHEALQEYARRRPETSSMGTTLTIAYLVGRRVFLGQVGDSRAYLIHGAECRRLTRDHTLAEKLIASGAAPEQVTHLRHILVNHIGAREQEVALDVEQALLDDGDWLLLCTDGLTDQVTDAEIAAVAAESADPQAACAALVQRANERGGKDNITVVAGQFHFPRA